MKKSIVILLVLSLLISVFAINVNASSKDDCEYVIENGEVTITKYHTKGKIVEIPSEIEGYPVTKLSKYSFLFLANVEKIVISNTVKEIEHSTFGQIPYLRELVLPESEMKVTGYPLYYSGLSEIDIPDTWTYIPDGMFAGLQNLVSVDIPNGITSIGNNAFHNCTYLSSISIPDSVEIIGQNAFYRSQIRVLRLPAKLKTIEKGMLVNGVFDQTLEIVAVPKSVTEIKADSGITSVKEIYYEGTKEDWDKIQKDKATANAELNIIFEKYPNEDEMPKLDPISTPEPTPVPTPDPLELKLNSLILDFEAETESLEDQSGRSVFKNTTSNEEKGAFLEFIKDDEIGLKAAHLKYTYVDYNLYYLNDVRDNITCEIYFKVKMNHKSDNSLIAALGNNFHLDLSSDTDCIPEDVMKMEIAPNWIRVSGTSRNNKVGLEFNETIDKWVHITYVRKDDTEIYYVNGRDVTNGGLKTTSTAARTDTAGFGYSWISNVVDGAEEYFAYMRVYAGASSPEWAKKMYDNRNTPYNPKNPTVPTIEGETVVGVREETTKESLMEFVYDNENSDIVTSEGTALAPTALVGTGAKLTCDGDEYSVVVKKDVSGDGKITSIDYLKLKRHFAGNTLTGVYQKAGDANSDDRITSADYLLTKRYFAK